VHQRGTDGALTPQPFETPVDREFLAGGGGLYSTAGDYLAFLQMLLHEGSLNGEQIIKPDTVALMGENHIGALPAGILKTNNPPLTNDVDFFPGQPVRWGLGYMLTLDPGPNGRSAGSVTWAGIFNTYYWLDPKRRVAGVIMTQILPFADPQTVALYGAFERGVYGAIGEA
jgi:CubicO group peptidase (beta-lactamase class C family)